MFDVSKLSLGLPLIIDLPLDKASTKYCRSKRERK